MHPNELLITDYVDDALTADARAEVERHLAGCADCRAMVDDMREIRRTAASLDLREPPARAWTRVERALQLEREHTTTRTGNRGYRFTTIAWLAAAAAVILAVVVGLEFRPGPRNAGARPTAAPSASSAGNVTTPANDAAQAVEAELRAAEEHYEKAISGLERIAKSEQAALDPRTAATLEKNLAVIDQAISESRAAVRAQPTSTPAQESLIENFKTKIGFLQDTVALINEMRKGNEAGAARIVSGLKQKGD